MKMLVTGGGGFLGKAIVKRLLQDKHAVTSLCRGDYPELSELGVEVFRGDLANEDIVLKAAQGCDRIYHVAARAGVWGSYNDFYKPNVVGTANILKACKTHQISKLIYTSTPSVIHAGGDVEGIDEAEPYPEHFETHYPATKAMAEKMVLEANGPDLQTVALRPHLIWGPEDNHLVPRIVDRGQRGKLKLVGGGLKLIDSVYIDNAADAHILAGDKLAPDAACAGKAYFITQDAPIPSHLLINGILNAAGLGPVQRSVHPKVAYAAGAVLEGVYNLFGVKSEPLMTRFVAKQLATAHWYDISAAKRDLGYHPNVDTQEGLRRLGAWFKQQGHQDVEH
jgi:nucleoside-diphosphate-sugar epimerase